MSSNSKPFAFKPSALAAKADKLWSESKTDYSATHSTVNHVHLEKKSLGDIASKNTAAPKEKEAEEAVSPQFVFGSKIADRIVNKDGETSKPGDSDDKTMTATELFKTAVKKDEKNGAKDFREEAKQEAERAKEVEKQHAGTSAVEITSGEENDTNIFQAPCKIWAFDKARGAYVEKGVCTLRINKRVENGLTHHRIVARTSSGTLRVIINSKIFSDMLMERVDKRLRISAMGPEIAGVQIFLLKIGFTKTSPIPDSDQFFNIMSDLLKLEKGENCRKRKADCDLNASSVKIKDGKEEEEVEDGFVMVNKPTDEEVKESGEPSASSADETSANPAEETSDAPTDEVKAAEEASKTAASEEEGTASSSTVSAE